MTKDDGVRKKDPNWLWTWKDSEASPVREDNRKVRDIERHQKIDPNDEAFIDKELDLTTIYIEIPKFYKYTERWCEENIEEKYDLNKICKMGDAEFFICNFFYDIGQEIYKCIKNTNLKFKTLTKRKLLNILEKEDSFDHLKWQLRYCGLNSDTSFENPDLIDELKQILDLYNADLAPKIVKDAAKEVLNMSERGLKQINEVIDYLNKFESIYEVKEQAKLEQELGLTNELEFNEPEKKSFELSKWEKIERKHVKVESGFLYILSNELMPGIYKIGFTSRNPDERAAEISSQVGLPAMFVVEKYWRSNDPYIVEQRIHKALEKDRKPGEYFQADIDVLCEEIEKHLQVSS